MSSLVLAPKIGSISAGSLRCPQGRTMRVPETTTVPDLPW
jgi:hypothetical protein